MSTGLFWTELRSSRQDLAALLAFRSAGLAPRSRRRIRLAAVLVVVVTVLVVVLPAYLGGPMPRERGGSMLALFPSMCLGFLVLAVIAAVASAGGREILPREEAVAFPVSTTTDHLGALLLAPLNVAWLLQAWGLLGVAAYVLGPDRLWAYELPVLLWGAGRHRPGPGRRLGGRGGPPRSARQRGLPGGGGRAGHGHGGADRDRPARPGPGLQPHARGPGGRHGRRELAVALPGPARRRAARPSACWPWCWAWCPPGGRCTVRCARSCGWRGDATSPGPRRPRTW